MKRKLVSLLAVLTLLLTVIPIQAYAIHESMLRFQIGDNNYYVTSGSAVEIRNSMDTAPIIYEDRTLLPIKYVIEPLGGGIIWNSDEKKVTITIDETTIELWIGNNTAKVNGISQIIDPSNKNVVPILVDPGRTMLPLRFISEILSCTINWIDKTENITIIDWEKQK